jgi:hypothetical protein
LYWNRLSIREFHMLNREQDFHETRKAIFKCLAWTLAFFLVTAGIAQGAERCKGKCCQEVRQPAGRDSSARQLSLSLETPIETLLPSCHLPKQSKPHERAVSATAPCEDESNPSCCHLGKPATGFLALAVKGHWGGMNRISHGDMVLSIHLQDLSSENETPIAVVGSTLSPRAAPIPLYLKNASFIC